MRRDSTRRITGGDSSDSDYSSDVGMRAGEELKHADAKRYDLGHGFAVDIAPHAEVPGGELKPGERL